MKLDNSQYQRLTRFFKYLLSADLLAFLTLMTASAFRVSEVKFLGALLTLILSGFVLVILYRTNELLRNRSLWISISACALIICTLVSLVLRYPSPNPLDLENPYITTQETHDPEFAITGWETYALPTNESHNEETPTSAYDASNTTENIFEIDDNA